MTAFTSKANGNWSATGQTTWNQVGTPGSGDTVSITHTITVDANTTIGNSPPPTPDGASAFAPTVSTSAGTTVTSLPTGAYRICYTNVDSNGAESSRSPETAATTFTNGSSKPRVTLPALPTGVTSRKIYMTAAAGASDTETLYATGVTGTTSDLISASWTDGTLTQAGSAAFPDASVVKVSSGSLTIGTSISLTVLGDIKLVNTTFTMNAGSTLTFDASSSVGTTNTNYACFVGTANNQSTAKVVVSGSSGSHVTITSNASGGNGRFAVLYNVNVGGVYQDHGGFDWTYADVSRLGTATLDSLTISDNSATRTVNFDHCVFDGNGRIFGFYNLPLASTLTFTNNTLKNTLHATNPTRIATAGGVATGGRTYTGNSFQDTLVPFISVQSATITGNYFNAGITMASGTATPWTSFQNNLLRKTAVADQLVNGDVDTNYFLIDEGTLGNPHFIDPDTGLTSRTVTFTNNIFEYTGPVYSSTSNLDVGDAMLHFDVAADYVLTYNLILPNTPGTDASGVLFTLFTGNTSFTSLRAEHNTYVLALNSASLNESNIGTNMSTGKVTFRDNLCWKPAGLTYSGNKYKITDVKNSANPGSSPQDFLTAADYNSCDSTKYAAGYAGAGYHVNLSYTPGVHDVDVAANFVDSTRNIATWAVSQGYASSGDSQATKVAAALTAIKAAPALTASSLMPYVRAGFAPQNASLHNAGHDSITIGAVEYVAANKPLLRRRREVALAA